MGRMVHNRNRDRNTHPIPRGLVEGGSSRDNGGRERSPGTECRLCPRESPARGPEWWRWSGGGVAVRLRVSNCVSEPVSY